MLTALITYDIVVRLSKVKSMKQVYSLGITTTFYPSDSCMSISSGITVTASFSSYSSTNSIIVSEVYHSNYT
jgi:hypothetical protein